MKRLVKFPSYLWTLITKSTSDDNGELKTVEEKTGIPYSIAENECFLRTIKKPYHYNEATQELKQSTLFMPFAETVGGVVVMEGVSLDRLAYCTPKESKRMAIENFKTNEDGSLVYDGLALISLGDIKEINSVPLEKLSPGFKKRGKFESTYTTALPKIDRALIGFDITALDDSSYCGVIATPMAIGEQGGRIPPLLKMPSSHIGNAAHAEIFYLYHLANPTPKEPFGTFIVEVAKLLTKASKKHIDKNPDPNHTPLL